MSRKSQFSVELKEQILKEVQEVGVVTTVAKKHNVDPKTVHNWMRVIRGRPKREQMQELRDLQKKLKNAELENLVLKELLKKTYPHWQSAESAHLHPVRLFLSSEGERLIRHIQKYRENPTDKQLNKLIERLIFERKRYIKDPYKETDMRIDHYDLSPQLKAKVDDGEKRFFGELSKVLDHFVDGKPKKCSMVF